MSRTRQIKTIACTDQKIADWPQQEVDSDSGDDDETSNALLTDMHVGALVVGEVVTSQGTPSIDAGIVDQESMDLVHQEEEPDVAVVLNTDNSS